MLFNSLHFMCFFPLVLAPYFVVPKKARYIWLLLASYYFYASWNVKYLLLIVFSTAVTFASGILLQREADGQNRPRRKKCIVAASFVINLAILAFFKYFGFALENFNIILGALGISLIQNPFDLLLPVGISFYTFQALGYTADVYRGEIDAERNFFKYALFVSFFPQLVAGPIERSKNLLTQIRRIHEKKLFEYERIRDGAILMLWGYFLKMVIADRLAILVNTVFTDYGIYGATALLAAAVAFSIQLYCDFSSYSTIAVGAAKIMGFTLTDNFCAPYFASGMKDFWSRWHISLSTWLRDYVYIPLGGSRMGTRRKYLNLLATFMISGIWHGANWTFVACLTLYGVFVVLEDATEKWYREEISRFSVNTDCFSYRFFVVIFTFSLSVLSMIFFRAPSVGDAVNYISRFVTRFDPMAIVDGELLTLGLDGMEMTVLVFSVSLLFLVEFIRYRMGLTVSEFLARQNLLFSWGAIISVVIWIMLFGEYGAGHGANQFIYFQF